MRRRPTNVLSDLQGWVQHGDRVVMQAELGARPEGGGYRDVVRYRTVGEVVLTRQRDRLIPIVVLMMLTSACVLAYAWPPRPQTGLAFEGQTVAVRGNDICSLESGAIECSIEHRVDCEEVYEGRHHVDDVCKSSYRHTRWFEGAQGVFTAFATFCGVRGPLIECRDETRVILDETADQVVGTLHMICARTGNRVQCYNHRARQLRAVDGAERIAAGPYHVCATTEAGVLCWHRHAKPFLSTHRTGHRSLAVASSHVCVGGSSAWCVPFDARDRGPWAMDEVSALTMVSRGDEVCGLADGFNALECSRSRSVPYLDLRNTVATELALSASRGCVRDGEGSVRCDAIAPPFFSVAW